jgi:hypothetical protein
MMEAAVDIASCRGNLLIHHRIAELYGQINETHMITNRAWHAVTTIGIANAFFQWHFRESVPTMDHLFRAQSIVERILTGEVFNLAQHGPLPIKSAIITQNNCRLVRRFGKALRADLAMPMLFANHPEGGGLSRRSHLPAPPGGYSERSG